MLYRGEEGRKGEVVGKERSVHLICVLLEVRRRCLAGLRKSHSSISVLFLFYFFPSLFSLDNKQNKWVREDRISEIM